MHDPGLMISLNIGKLDSNEINEDHTNFPQDVALADNHRFDWLGYVYQPKE